VNDKKKLAVVIAALVVVIAASVAVYNTYKDRVDPMTGQITQASQAMSDITVAALSKAPDFTMEDAKGKTLKLSDLQGKPVVLNFWTSWCGYCKEEMPYFESAYKQYGDQVQFVMLNNAKAERTSGAGQAFIKDAGYTFPVFYETAGQAVSLYGLRGFPATIFIDADGNIVSRNVGAITQEKLTQNIKSLVG